MTKLYGVGVRPSTKCVPTLLPIGQTVSLGSQSHPTTAGASTAGSDPGGSRCASGDGGFEDFDDELLIRRLELRVKRKRHAAGAGVFGDRAHAF